jgi:outer membrane protein
MINKSIKLWVSTLSFVALLAASTQAQRIAYVNVGEILESVEEYQSAQVELDRMANQWRSEIAQEYDKIKGMYNRYQAEQVLLSDDTRPSAGGGDHV